MTGLLKLLTGGWKVYAAGGALLALIGAGTGIYILILQRDLAQAKAALADASTRAELCAERLTAATRDLEAVAKVSRANEEALNSIRDMHAAAIAELSRELTEQANQAPKIVTLEKVIHAKAKECVGGVPPAIRGVPQWLRNNPESPVGGAGPADRGQGDRGRAPAHPGRPIDLLPRAAPAG